MQRFDDLGKRVEQMKKAHEVELRNLKKTSRKACLEFFKNKSETVMKVFKQEQMHMVEEYYILKKEEAKKERTIQRLSRIMRQQERTISDITCFVHDCLDEIFAEVEKR